VPGAVVVHLRDAVGVDAPAAGLQPGVTGQRGHVGGGHAAEPVAVDVEHLDRVHDDDFAVQELARRVVLVLERDGGPPRGQCLLVVGHPGLQERPPPRLQAAHVGDHVGEDLDV
jgi:hypothetical protein